MSFDLADIQATLQRAEELPDGPVKVTVHEEAVRMADVNGDIEWQFYTRHELIRATFSAGEGDKMMVALSWCLGRCDEAADSVYWLGLLWQCKHALSYATSFPGISRARIAQLAEDILVRYRQHGASPRGIYMFMMSNQLGMGWLDDAREYYQQWREAPHDDLTEPPDWEDYFHADYLICLEETEHAWDLARVYLQDPGHSRELFPWMVHLFLIELFRQREFPLAADVCLQSYRSCATNPKYLSHVATHMTFWALTGNLERAVRMFERHLPWRLNSRVPGSCLSFDLRAWGLLRLLRANHRNKLKLNLPETFPLYQDDGDYSTAHLADWFEQKSRDLVHQFNQRNGNDCMTERMERGLELDELAVDFPY